MMKDVKLQNIGEVRTYIFQAWHEFKNGFVKEFDLPSFYSNVDLISTFFENEYLTKEINISKWKNFLTIIRNDAQKINDGTSTGEFIYNYLIHHLELIEGEIVKFETINSEVPLNDYIFSSEKGKKIFNEWHELHKDTKKHADYSFIFRVLEKDGFLNEHVGESIFRKHLEEFDIVLGKLKTLSDCNTDKRIKLYYKIKNA